jgi:Zn-finger nucleic acid-binding protein
MSSFDTWDDHFDEVEDDIEIDVCLNCGRYFEWTELQAKLARERHPRQQTLEQQCVPCLRGVPPPHEY